MRFTIFGTQIRSKVISGEQEYPLFGNIAFTPITGFFQLEPSGTYEGQYNLVKVVPTDDERSELLKSEN